MVQSLWKTDWQFLEKLIIILHTTQQFYSPSLKQGSLSKLGFPN